jgi:hypothetical protein
VGKRIAILALTQCDAIPTADESGFGILFKDNRLEGRITSPIERDPDTAFVKPKVVVNVKIPVADRGRRGV